MRRFIINYTKIIFLFFVIITLLFAIMNITVRKNTVWKVEAKHVVLGHSHPKCAINDSLIKNIKNLSSHGENYFYTYLKLKKILLDNNQIETVFIEFTNNYINSKYDEIIWDDKHLNNFYHKYFPFMGGEDLDLLFEMNKNVASVYLSKTFRKEFQKILNSNYSEDIGGYSFSNLSKIDTLLTNYIEPQIYNNDKTSIYTIEYLKKIISLCQNKNIEIIFIRCPQHKYDNSFQNEHVFKALKDSLFSNIQFLDFINFPINNNEFRDFGHLNYKGARKFSVWLNELMDKGLMDRKNKEEFIKQEMLNIIK